MSFWKSLFGGGSSRKIRASDVTYIIMVVPKGSVEPTVPKAKVVSAIYESLNPKMHAAILQAGRRFKVGYTTTSHWQAGSSRPDFKECLSELFDYLGNNDSIYIQPTHIESASFPCPSDFFLVTAFKEHGKARQVRLAEQSPTPG